MLALFARLRGGGDAAYAARLAQRFEADLSRPLGELSRGNRQKLGLIQALGLTAAGVTLAAAGCVLFERRDVGV